MKFSGRVAIARSVVLNLWLVQESTTLSSPKPNLAQPNSEENINWRVAHLKSPFLYVKAPPFLGTSFIHDSENSVLRVMCIRRFMALLPPSREAGKKISLREASSVSFTRPPRRG